MLLLSTSVFSQTAKPSVDDMRNEIKAALREKSANKAISNIISDSKTAIEVAEPILFKIYGKDNILGERPYNVYFVDGYWLVSGSLPKKYNVGGTFSIILSAKDGQVIKLIHYK